MLKVEDWFLENKGKIDKAVELIGQGCEVLAGTMGMLHPLLEAVFKATAQFLLHPDSEASAYISKQFQQLQQCLEGVQGEADMLAREMQRISINKRNFEYEANIISQYEKFQDVVNAKPEFRKKKMEKFLSHFEITNGDGNLDALYNAVVGEWQGEPLLEVVMATEQKSRRPLEAFCSSLKKLFVVGIIAVMGHASLKQGSVGEEQVQKWQQRMEEVERRMKAAVDECVENFAVQAKQDIKQKLLETKCTVDNDFIQPLLAFLAQKYDWVAWSILVVNDKKRLLSSRLADKEYVGLAGCDESSIINLTEEGVRVLISFSVEPTPIDNTLIREQLEKQQLRGKVENVARTLANELPNYAVLVVSPYKTVVEANTFPGDCYCYETHKRAYICIHS